MVDTEIVVCACVRVGACVCAPWVCVRVWVGVCACRGVCVEGEAIPHSATRDSS